MKERMMEGVEWAGVGGWVDSNQVDSILKQDLSSNKQSIDDSEHQHMWYDRPGERMWPKEADAWAIKDN